MDKSVIDAVARWPNVPAVFGWLSLTARGQWRLHPDGQAQTGGPGEPISNGQILAFIGRNYASDGQGRWFFQNGPQRVYVRLDAAPWILFVDDATEQLSTHTGRVVKHISHLWVNETGQVFIETEHGIGLIADRDLARFLDGAAGQDGQSFEDWWAFDTPSAFAITHFTHRWPGCTMPLPVTRLASDQPVDEQLMFIANPKPS